MRKSKVDVMQAWKMVAEGVHTKKIAQHFDSTDSAVRMALMKVMKKRGWKNREHAVAVMVREGVI